MADFNFYLNRQGVKGNKGEKGDQGYSPTIGVKTNTSTEFVLTINNEFNSFDTPNLISTQYKNDLASIAAEVAENEASINELRIDISTINTTLDSQNSAIENVSSRVNTLETDVQENTIDIVNLKNTINSIGDASDLAKLGKNNTFTGFNVFENNNGISILNSSSKGGRIVPNTYNLEINSYNDAGILIHPLGQGSIQLHSDSEVSLSAPAGHILSNGFPILTTETLIAGDNVTINKNIQTGQVTINATGGEGSSELDNYIEGSTTDNTTTISAKGGKALELSAPTIVIGDNLVNTIDSADMQLYLKQNDIVSGGHITIEKTATGIKLTGEAPTDITGVESRLTAVENNVSNLTTEVNNQAGDIAAQDADISNLKTNKQNKLIAGDNISLTDNDDGTTTITSTGGGEVPTNVVTTNTVQDITATKNFTDIRFTSTDNRFARMDSTSKLWHNGNLVLNGTYTLRGNLVPTNATYLRQLSTTGESTVIGVDNLVAGDNITINKTATSSGVPIVTISATGGGGSGDITAAGNNIFTGINTFSSDVNFESGFTLRNGDQASQVYLNGAGYISMGSKAQIGNINIQSEDIINTFDNVYFLKQNSVIAGDNITVTQNSDGTITISSLGGSSESIEEKYGIQGDYSTRYGIIDNPNGIIEYSATSKNISLKQGLVLKTANTQGTKITISNDITHTVTSTGAFTLFFVEGDLIECGKVDYSISEPTDNGVDNYQAWFNPDKTLNPTGTWQFKSNDSGNVWRNGNGTPIADMVASASGITSVSYIGYRIIDDDIFAQQSDIESIQNNIETLTTSVNNAVTLDTAQSITGEKIFYDSLSISGRTNDGVEVGGLRYDTVYADMGSPFYNYYDNTNVFNIARCIGDQILEGAVYQSHFVKVNASTYKKYAALMLDQYNLTAGDGITRTTTSTGSRISANKEFAGHQAMPSNKYVSLTLGASGTKYTAPADGYFAIAKINGDNTQRAVTMVNARQTGTASQSFNLTVRSLANTEGMTHYLFMPAAKNDTVIVNYTTTGNTDSFIFIYALGSEPSS